MLEVNMKRIRANSSEDLQLIADEFGDTSLFRGQTTHYAAGEYPSISTSFQRKGCIPSEMAKWSRFAQGVLENRLGVSGESLELSQAILQHFGWRSFYVDLTSDIRVAAWFASHEYSEGHNFEMCEDILENPVTLVKRYASYVPGTLVGNLYVLDKHEITKCSNLVDLTTLETGSGKPRFEVQKAWLMGPMARDELIPHSCYTAHVTAPQEVLAQFAAKQFEKTSDIFPGRNEDPVLQSLLDLPWLEIYTASDKEQEQRKSGIPFFRRAIDFPEYENSFQKHLPGNVALYQGFCAASSGMAEKMRDKFDFIAVPEITIIGSPNPIENSFPLILEKTVEGRVLCFEIDSLLRQITEIDSSEYCKGLAIQRINENLLEVGEFVIDHPGMEITGAGVNTGWYYEVDKVGVWVKVEHPDQCPCDNNRRHEVLFRSLTIIEAWLADPAAFHD